MHALAGWKLCHIISCCCWVSRPSAVHLPMTWQHMPGVAALLAEGLCTRSYRGTQPRLLVQPGRPLVGHQLILEAVALRHVRQEALHLRRHVVLDEPELGARPARSTVCYDSVCKICALGGHQPVQPPQAYRKSMPAARLGHWAAPQGSPQLTLTRQEGNITGM